MNSPSRATLFVSMLLLAMASNTQEIQYQFHRLLLESEVVIDKQGSASHAFDPSIEVQVASFKERVAADFIQQNLSADFATLKLKVETISSRSYFTVRVYGFKESRTVAHVIDQLVKAGFAPLKIQPK